MASERDVFEALRAALAGAPSEMLDNPGLCLDADREDRTGTPEVILAEGKSLEQLEESVRRMVERCSRVIISRVSPGQRRYLEETFPHLAWRDCGTGRTVVARRPDFCPVPCGGRIVILTAGASDLPTAQEARLVAEEMGCEVRVYADIGVAGLHRLVVPLREALQWPADVLIVAAGMDGVLPSVVAGLVSLPVIGLPTPVGYGRGGRGEAALLSMLQSCAPGLVVVNVDNGIGAGVAAARIARVAASARGPSEPVVKGVPQEG